MFGVTAADGAPIPLASIRLAAPARPRQFIGIWNNFHALAEKYGNLISAFPLYFLKSPNSIVGPDSDICLPTGLPGKVIYEGELGIVIGHKNSIFGYTVVNDITALDVLNSDPSFPQWARAKSFTTFGPLGPCIETELSSNAEVKVSLNGRVRQHYPLADMIISPQHLVELIGSEVTLSAGDVIACGTSVGVLPIRAGMTVEVSITGIGTLRNFVRDCP